MSDPPCRPLFIRSTCLKLLKITQTHTSIINISTFRLPFDSTPPHEPFTTELRLGIYSETRLVDGPQVKGHFRQYTAYLLYHM